MLKYFYGTFSWARELSVTGTIFVYDDVIYPPRRSEVQYIYNFYEKTTLPIVMIFCTIMYFDICSKL